MIQDNQTLLWLALARLFVTRPRIAIRLIEATTELSDIFRLTPMRIREITEDDVAAVEVLGAFCDWKLCEQDADFCARNGVQVIGYTDHRYPALLRMIHDPPVVLYARGDASLLGAQKACVAMVGSRKATRFGLSKAYEIARDLARQGIAVVSGMAYGIDSAAHRGALDAGGTTIAVWGAGPDIIYPRQHRELARQIMEQGVAITEFPPKTLPVAYHFPQRNRIVSGISLGAIIIEAAEASGSLITARYALEHGREVCALPGGAGLVPFRGSNRLLREGATLVETAEDVMNALFAVKEPVRLIRKTGQRKRPSVDRAAPRADEG